MLSAAISTIALALAIGPHLQVSLQAAIDEAQPATETVIPGDTVTPSVSVAGSEDQNRTAGTEESTEPISDLSEDPVDAIIDEPEVDLPTVADPDPAITESQAEVAPTVRSSQVPEAEWPAILGQVSTALSSARTATGNFAQTNADGSVMTGTFALSRPGRMRFDYDDPTPILIVSDGTTVAMEDSELETVDRVPIGATPLGLILSTDLQFDEDVEVLSVMRNADRVGVRVSDATGELEGTLTMVFDAESYDLLGWLAMDGNLQTTVVDLVDVETNVRVDPRLFRLDEAEDEEDER
nr:outer membrane lipoprotein carrier protein LolA [Hyphomonas sp. Mor2]